jgi:hypothetical protein
MYLFNSLSVCQVCTAFHLKSIKILTCPDEVVSFLTQYRKFQERELRGLSPSFYIHVRCERFTYM